MEIMDKEMIEETYYEVTYGDVFHAINLKNADELLEKAVNKETLDAELKPLSDGEDPLAEIPERRVVNVNGRKEHEAIIQDAAKCRELGLDQVYETIVYLKRWGNWLS